MSLPLALLIGLLLGALTLSLFSVSGVLVAGAVLLVLELWRDRRLYGHRHGVGE